MTTMIKIMDELDRQGWRVRRKGGWPQTLRCEVCPKAI